MTDSSDQPAPTRNPTSGVVAILGGVLCAVNGPSPTNSAVVDALFVVGSVAAVIWFASLVSVRFAAALALGAGCFSMTWPGLVLGVVSYIAASGTSGSRPPPTWLNSALIALALNLAARSDLDGFFGASSVVGIGIAAVAVLRAVPTRSRRHRRALAAVVATAAVVAALAGAGLAKAALDSRDHLSEGEQTVRRGLDELVAGDIETAVASFDEATASFSRAHDHLSNPLTSLAAVVPVAAQHRRAGIELTDEARRAAQTLSVELAPISIDDLTFAGGRIDIDAIAALAEPLDTVRADIAGLRTTIADLDDPWLISSVRDRLVRLDDDIQEQLDRSDLFVDVVEHVPSMLGLDGPRRYFVAFTTPSEVRGLGGFMGNWAEITVDDGAIELTRFGRSDDLDERSVPGDRTITGPQDWLARYGRYGFANGPGGGTNVSPWKNITVSPSMSATGAVIAELYPQSGGTEIDGVFAFDVFAVAALLELTGPIELPDGGGTLDADNAEQFFLKEQYDDLGEQFDIPENEQRIDQLEIVSTEVLERLLNTALPPPNDILDLLAPLVDQGSIAGFAVAPGEQGLFTTSGIAGTFTEAPSGDSVSVSFNNSIGNKIDYFLQSSATYRVLADQADSTIQAELEITMSNEAPSAGEPSYVIGNSIDRPFGVNRTLVSVHSRLRPTEATLDGVEVATRTSIEAGHFVTDVVVELPAGESAVVGISFSDSLDLSAGYELVVRTPPLANWLRFGVSATVEHGTASTSDTVDLVRPGRHDFAVDRSDPDDE